MFKVFFSAQQAKKQIAWKHIVASKVFTSTVRQISVTHFCPPKKANVSWRSGEAVLLRGYVCHGEQKNGCPEPLSEGSVVLDRLHKSSSRSKDSSDTNSKWKTSWCLAFFEKELLEVIDYQNNQMIQLTVSEKYL